jgi:hypothetical protein
MPLQMRNEWQHREPVLARHRVAWRKQLTPSADQELGTVIRCFALDADAK